MTAFSWDYVSQTTKDSLTELGRTTAATIAAAVEPGIYLVAPDTVYEVRPDDAAGTNVVLRNGAIIAGDGHVCDWSLRAVAAEMGGVGVTVDLRTTVDVTVR